MPHACGALYGASSTRAKVAHLQGGRIIKVCEQLSLFIFAFVLAKINVLNFGIAKMVLKKPPCVRKFSSFDFALAFACRQGKSKCAKLVIAKTGLSNPKCGEESKKQKNCLSKSKKRELSTEMPFSVKPLFLCPSTWRITTNVLRIDVGGLTKLPVSIPTNVYIKILMFLFPRPPAYVYLLL